MTVDVVTTEGVIPAPDPWRLHADDVVGEVRMTWWGAGWLITMAPVLLVGALVVLVVRAAVTRDWKLPATLTLGALVVTVALVWYQPLINAQQLGFEPSRGGGADATYVGTGLLPIRLQAYHGDDVVMRDGEVGRVHVSEEDEKGRLRVDLAPAIPFWWWVVLVLLCFVPALYALIIGFPPLDDRAGRRSAEVDVEPVAGPSPHTA